MTAPEIPSPRAVLSEIAKGNRWGRKRDHVLDYVMHYRRNRSLITITYSVGNQVIGLRINDRVVEGRHKFRAAVAALRSRAI